MNFVEKIFGNWFERVIQKWDNKTIFTPTNGWIGLTVQQPLF